LNNSATVKLSASPVLCKRRLETIEIPVFEARGTSHSAAESCGGWNGSGCWDRTRNGWWAGFAGRVEVHRGPERASQLAGHVVKAQIVRESFEPGVTVSEGARRHRMSPQHLTLWRRAAREGRLTLTQTGDVWRWWRVRARLPLMRAGVRQRLCGRGHFGRSERDCAEAAGGDHGEPDC